MVFLAVALITIACSQLPSATVETPSSSVSAVDNTIYGLACDGSNDTIVVFLRMPYTGANPDTLNILQASTSHKVFGDVRIGDRLAIVRNAQDSTVADIVIVTQDLMGPWCYKVNPTLKRRADTDDQTYAQIVSQLPDSIAQMLKMELEYGMNLKADSVVTPIGMVRRPSTVDEESPVEFPRQKMYRQWCIKNGRILLMETQMDSIGNAIPVVTDTAELVMLTPDTLVLRMNGVDRGYYRRTDGTDVK